MFVLLPESSELCLKNGIIFIAGGGGGEVQYLLASLPAQLVHQCLQGTYM